MNRTQQRTRSSGLAATACIAIVLALSFVGCPIQHYDGIQSSPVPLDGSVTYGLGTKTGSLTIGGHTVDGRECSGTLYVGYEKPGSTALDIIPDNCDQFVSTMLVIECAVPEKIRVRLKAGDLRQWVVGQVPAESVEQRILFDYDTPCSTNGSCDCKLDTSAVVDIVVTDAVGEAAAMPGFVTDDFERRLEVSFDSGAPTTGHSSVGQCPTGVSMQGTLSTTIDRTDFRYVEQSFLGDCR